MPLALEAELKCMEKFKIRDQYHGPFYLRAEIRKLVTRGLVEVIPQTDLSYNGEDYSAFIPADQVNDDETYWPRHILWFQSCANGRITYFEWNKLPHITEDLLFREFHYRFDPAWRPEKSVRNEPIRICSFRKTLGKA